MVCIFDIPDCLLDQQPSILKITTHARTAEWKQFGVHQKLNIVVIDRCSDYTEMYQLRIMEKDEDATRRKLISALRAIPQNNV